MLSPERLPVAVAKLDFANEDALGLSSQLRLRHHALNAAHDSTCWLPLKTFAAGETYPG